MSEQELQGAEVHARFEQMGRIAVTARFDIMLYLLDN